MHEQTGTPGGGEAGQSTLHWARGRFNAWFLDACDPVMHRMYGSAKQRLLGGVGGTVVEIGPGAGANMRYYPRGQRVVAVEPNAAMHARLRRRAAAHGVDLDIRQISGERICLPDGSADVAVATLLLCTAADPAGVLAEIRRILKPGGRYVFIEHVAAEGAGPLRVAQRVLHGPQRWLFEGCDCTRRSWETIESAGFTRVDLRREHVGSPMFWIAPHIIGEAVR